MTNALAVIIANLAYQKPRRKRTRVIAVQRLLADKQAQSMEWQDQPRASERATDSGKLVNCDRT